MPIPLLLKLNGDGTPHHLRIHELYFFTCVLQSEFRLNRMCTSFVDFVSAKTSNSLLFDFLAPELSLCEFNNLNKLPVLLRKRAESAYSILSRRSRNMHCKHKCEMDDLTGCNKHTEEEWNKSIKQSNKKEKSCSNNTFTWNSTVGQKSPPLPIPTP